MTTNEAINNTPPGIDRLLEVIAALRHPKTGCPWDLKQTHETLKPYVLEEAYEVVEAINDGSSEAIKEELGDLLLQVVLHGQIAQESGAFDFQAIAEGISEKLIRRHPHVFSNTTVDSVEAVIQNWDSIKQAEKAQKALENNSNPLKTQSMDHSILKGVSRQQSALMRTTEISHRAVKVGFRWPSDDSLWACVMSEFDEFKAETLKTPPSQDALEDELGDILFATVSLANHYGVNSEVALTRATQKFIKRFQAMEDLAEKPLETLSFEEWDDLWSTAKAKTNP